MTIRRLLDGSDRPGAAEDAGKKRFLREGAQGRVYDQSLTNLVVRSSRAQISTAVLAER